MPNTIEELLRRLGKLASLVAPPGGSLGELSGVHIWEPGDFPRPAEGSVVFGVGLAEDEVDRMLSSLGPAACAGVVLREPGNGAARASWVRRAREAGFALILLRPAASWSEALRAASQLTESPEPPAVTNSSDIADAASEVPRGDLFALADAFADLVGGPIIVEDANFRVLSYSSFTGPVDRGRDTAILGRRIPPEWLAYLDRTGSIELLRSTSEVVDLASGPWHAQRRLITSVRTEARLLGILWVAEGNEPLPAHAASALRRAARLAVPHLLRHQDAHRSERHRRGELVHALLDGRGQLHRHADELGLPRRADFAVLGFAPADGASMTEDQWDRITDHVALSCEGFRWHAAVARLGGTVFALVALPEGRTQESVARLGRDIVNRSLPVLFGDVRGTVSTMGPRLGNLKARRLQAEDAMAVVRKGSVGRFARYEDVQAEVILRELAQLLGERPDLRLPGLAALAAEDLRKNSEFRHTLRVFLSCGGQYPEAARRLGLHVTTLRYRLKRITAISGLALDDPAVRLVSELLLTTIIEP